MTTMVEKVVAQIAKHEADTGKPPTHLRLTEESFVELVEEMATQRQANRAEIRRLKKNCKTVMVLNVRILRGFEMEPPKILHPGCDSCRNFDKLCTLGTDFEKECKERQRKHWKLQSQEGDRQNAEATD